MFTSAALIDFKSILEGLNKRINEQYDVIKSRSFFHKFFSDLNSAQEVKALGELQKIINEASHNECLLFLLKVRKLQGQVHYQELDGFQGIAELLVKKCVVYIEAHIEHADFQRIKKSLCEEDLKLIQTEIYYLDRKLIQKAIEKTILWLKESKLLLKKDIVDPKELDQIISEFVMHHNTLVELAPNWEKESGTELYSDLLLFKCGIHQKRSQLRQTKNADDKEVLTDFERVTRIIIDRNDNSRFGILCEYYLSFSQIMLPLAKKHFLILEPHHQLYSMAMGVLAKLYTFFPAKKSVEKTERRLFKALACATEWLDSSIVKTNYQKNAILDFYKKISCNEKLRSIEEMKTQHPYVFLGIQFELYIEKKKLQLPTDKLYLEILVLISSFKQIRNRESPQITYLDIFKEALGTRSKDPAELSELNQIVNELYSAFINIFNHPLCRALEAGNHQEAKKLYLQIEDHQLEVDLHGKNSKQQTLEVHLREIRKHKTLEGKKTKNPNSSSFVEKEQLDFPFSEDHVSPSESSSSHMIVFLPNESAPKAIPASRSHFSTESSSTSASKKYVL